MSVVREGNVPYHGIARAWGNVGAGDMSEGKCPGKNVLLIYTLI